jgi:tRNA threonylcarbamoyladenosine biosynthesis protein TsaB
LAVETSSRMGSAAIALGAELLAEGAFSAPMRHSAEIFPIVCGLLERFDRRPGEIEHIYISVGPGSFTGLRIAATLAKTMNLANSAKIIAVDTLDVIAANAVDLVAADNLRASNRESRPWSRGPIAAILDAKRGQFFIAVYSRTASGGVWEKVLGDCLMTASQFLERFACKEEPIWLLGDGLLYYKDTFRADGVRFMDEQYWSPRAGKVHLLGRQMALKEKFADPVALTPNYLRTPDAKPKPR